MDKTRRLGDVLASNLPPAVLTAMSIGELVKSWESIAGPKIGKKSRPVSIEGDILVVVCETPSVAHVLYMMGGAASRRIENRWKLGIRGIRAVVGKTEKNREIRKKESSRLEPSPSVVQACLDYAGEKIDRPDVAQALASLMATYMRKFPEDVSRETKILRR